ncbi:OmpA family protein [Fibrivirga algicola]|uniref:OmpA family protein n=1 Tax=Fibrivirga algicola TaxID=2950420 RepID=UPI0014192B15|nr:OmpA family protein [Fibrivirga algicola]
MLVTEKQGSNRPYHQTEQTNYVQQTISAEQLVAPQQPTTFSVVDALEKKPLMATICLFFTKTGEKKCVTADNHGLAQVNLDHHDIIALEVISAGYQPYAGNLIVDQLEGRRHEIQLQRELTLLTVKADDASQCAIRMGNKQVPLLPIPDRVGQFVAYALTPGRYELLVTTKTTTIRRFIQLQQGLNTEEIKSITSVSTARKSAGTIQSITTRTISRPTLLLPDSIPMIYFQQGSYQLRVDSQEVLRQVAAYLKKHPSYTLRITGHTDNVGDERLNLNLSQDRAKVTSTFLNGQGIQDSRLIQNGLGGKYPLVPNDTETNKALNRRVALTLIPAQ